MKKSIIVITGPPKSGVSIFKQCLKILGLKSADDNAQTDIATIHGLLFQDIGYSATMVGNLPQGWMRTPVAEKARQRINALLASCIPQTNSIILADPFLCRFLPLWSDAFEEAGMLSAKFVFMTRHPLETARSLSRDGNLDLDKAHLLWLAHVRDVLRHCRYDALVTFDQLLADPVSTMIRVGRELELDFPHDPRSASSSLLDFVRPELRRHNASSPSDREKQIFRGYDLLYQEIRHGQWGEKPKDPSSAQVLEGAGNDLIDSLLDAIGKYEKQSANRHVQIQKMVSEKEPSLFAQVVFPSARKGGKTVETIPLVADQWQKISLPVPEPDLLKEKLIIFKPLNVNGTVKISAISLVNQATGTSLWSAKTSDEFGQISVRGSAVRLPSKENFILWVTGNAPGMFLPFMKKSSDVPLALKLWVKVSKEQNEVRSSLPKHLLIDRRCGIGSIHHLSSSGGTVISKCLAAMQDVVLLSEINPCSPMGGVVFNPFDPLGLFQKQYPELSYRNQDDLKKIFLERIAWTSDKCVKHNKFLIVRDHSHSDFLFCGCVDTPPVHSFLSQLYSVKSIVTLRNPIDSYLSMKASNFPTDVKTFDSYCKRVVIFLDKYHSIEVFRYEDFVKNPDMELEKMCNVYGIEYNPAWRDNFYKIQLTGNSGRGNQFKEIKELERRRYDDAFKTEVLGSEYFSEVSEKYNYQPPKYSLSF